MSTCYIDTQLTELAHTLSAEQDREDAIERYSDAVRARFDVQVLGEALAAAADPFPLIDAIKAGAAGGIEEELTALLAEHMSRAALALIDAHERLWMPAASDAALSQAAEQHDPLAVSDHCGECGEPEPECACDERIEDYRPAAQESGGA